MITPNRVAISLILIIGLVTYCFAPIVAFSQQWPLFEALRTTAAIIFAVVGAWIAIAFPERVRLMGAVGPAAASTANGSRFLDLFAPVVHSTLILCAVLLIGVAAPVVKSYVENPVTIEYLRRASFTLLVVMTLCQVWTVLLTLIPADALKAMMDRDRSLENAAVAIQGLGPQIAPPPGNNVP